MPNDEQTAAARSSAYSAALALADDLPTIAAIVFDSAERAVMRHLLSRLLDGGEVGYWKLVEQEVWRVEMPSADQEAAPR